MKVTYKGKYQMLFGILMWYSHRSVLTEYQLNRGDGTPDLILFYTLISQRYLMQQLVYIWLKHFSLLFDSLPQDKMCNFQYHLWNQSS